MTIFKVTIHRLVSCLGKPLCLKASLGTVVLVTGLLALNLPPTIWSLLIPGLGVFCLPFLVGANTWRIPDSSLLSLLLLAPVSYGLITLFMTLFRILGAPLILQLLLPPLLTGGFFRFLGRRGARLPVIPRHRADIWILPLVVASALTLVIPAFRNVGRTLPEGRAYRAYFTADFVWGMALVSELAKSDTLPRNPFLKGEDLHYYWPHHQISGMEHRLHPQFRTDHILILNNTLMAVLFLLFFYAVLRYWVPSPHAALAGLMSGLLLSSAEGVYLIHHILSHHAPLSLFRMFNVDAVTRWLMDGLPIDGLPRLLLYQPQHQMGLMLCLMALMLCHRAMGANAARRDWLSASGLLSLALFFSPMLALMSGVMAIFWVLAHAPELIQDRTFLKDVPLLLLPPALALITLTGMDMTSPHAHVLSLGPNYLAFHRPFSVIALGLGPLIFLALPGIRPQQEKPQKNLSLLLALWLSVCMFFYFMVDVPEHQHVYVGWRAGHLAILALSVLVARGFSAPGGSSQEQARYRRLPLLLLIPATLLALPTVLMDLYNATDISNRIVNRGTGIPWTLVLSHDELMALKWISQHTLPSETVQVDTRLRGAATWAYIPAFAGRRMAAGIPISMVPLEPYVRANNEVCRLFSLSDPVQIHAICQKWNIHYLYLGDQELRRYPTLPHLLRTAPSLFHRVFHGSSNQIFRVVLQTSFSNNLPMNPPL